MPGLKECELTAPSKQSKQAASTDPCMHAYARLGTHAKLKECENIHSEYGSSMQMAQYYLTVLHRIAAMLDDRQ
jgi:hypothetical protein